MDGAVAVAVAIIVAAAAAAEGLLHDGCQERDGL
jgi:hypothetical protein